MLLLQNYFQEEVLRVAGEEALELGLLMGTENMTPQQEETEVFSFPHLMLQEFLASLYLSQLPKVQKLSDTGFPYQFVYSAISSSFFFTFSLQIKIKMYRMSTVFHIYF